MTRIVAAAIALVWSNVALPATGFDQRRRSLANAVFATAFAAVFGRRVPVVTPRAIAVGAAAAAVPVTAYAVATALPGARDGLAKRARETQLRPWITFDIPVGTVYAEELIFRGVLTPMLGPTCGALVFGLWHIHPAKVAGENVAATVAVTAAGGLVFDWLARRGGALAAPALAHLAINVGGAVASHVAGRA